MCIYLMPHTITANQETNLQSSLTLYPYLHKSQTVLGSHPIFSHLSLSFSFSFHIHIPPIMAVKTKQSLTILFPLHHHCRTNLPSLGITIGTLYVMCCTRSLQQRSSQLSRTNEYIKFVFNLKFSKWITFEMIVCSVSSVGRAQVS